MISSCKSFFSIGLLFLLGIQPASALGIVRCDMIKLLPTMGPNWAQSNVSISLECDSSDNGEVFRLLNSVTVTFDSVAVPIISVNQTGYTSIHSTIGQDERKIAWIYTIQVQAPLVSALQPDTSSLVVLVSLENPDTTGFLSLSGRLPYQYYNISQYRISAFQDIFPISSSGGQTLCIGKLSST